MTAPPQACLCGGGVAPCPEALETHNIRQGQSEEAADQGYIAQKRRRDWAGKELMDVKDLVAVQSSPPSKRQRQACPSSLGSHFAWEAPSSSDSDDFSPPSPGDPQSPCHLPSLHHCQCVPGTTCPCSPCYSPRAWNEPAGCPLAWTPETHCPFSPQPSCHCSSRACSVFGMPTGNLEDRFQLGERVLGSGQFGSVRECFDRATGERVACKTLRKAAQGDVQKQTREIQNEVSVMLRLGGNDGLVQLRGVFEDEDQVHLVMDCCRGGELFDEVVRRGRFEERDAAQLFSEIVKAVAFCHARGVVHRDLKPENLLLARPLRQGVALSEEASQGPTIKLADFGLAVALGPDQSLKGMAGSPFYMAPEVLAGEYGTKADLWSLGVILYILLTGSPPFYGEKDEDVFQLILQNKLDLNSPVCAAMSREAKNLLNCLLQQDPTKRPSVHRVLTHPWIVGHVAPRNGIALLRRRVQASSKHMPVHVL